jgi:hypothetical protein
MLKVSLVLSNGHLEVNLYMRHFSFFMDEMLGKHGKLACVDPHSCKELATGVIQL